MTEQEKIRLRRLLIDLEPILGALGRLSTSLGSAPLGLRAEAVGAAEALESFCRASRTTLQAERNALLSTK